MPVFTNSAAQHSIDAEIADHQAAIINLRHKRNSLTAIYSLPEDILSLIFVLCKDSSKVTEVPILWQTILSVCSQWRHLALASPLFSNTIILSHTHNLRAMLVHSGQAPIHLYYPLNEIYANGTEDKGRAAFRDVLDKGGDRLNKLFATCTTRNVSALNELFDALRTYRTPSLQEMSLRHKGPHRGRIYICCQPLPWASMPSLRHLTLHNTLVPLDMPPLPYLTSLTLTCAHFLSGEGIPSPYAAKFLQKTPNVEVVDIDHMVEPWASGPFPGMDDGVPKDSILLSRLRSLTIRSDPIHGSEFMKCLSLPSLVQLRAYFIKKMKSSTSTVSQKRPLAKAALSSLLSALTTTSLDLISQAISVTFGFGQCTLGFVVRLGALDPDMIHVGVSHQHHILDLRDYMDVLESSQFKSHVVKLTLFNGQTNGDEIEDGNLQDRSDQTNLLEAMEGDRWAKLLPSFESLRTLCILNAPLSFLTTTLLPLPISLQDKDKDQFMVPAAFPEFNQNPFLQLVKLTAVECRPSHIITSIGASDDASTSSTSFPTNPLTPVVDETVEELDDSRPTVMKEVGMEDENLDEGKMEDDENMGSNLVDLAYVLKKRQEAGMPRIRLIFERCGITPRQLLFLKDYADVELRNK